MIKDLELKLEGKLPVTRMELFELVSSWGRNNTIILDYFNLYKCESKECYPLENLDAKLGLRK